MLLSVLKKTILSLKIMLFISAFFPTIVLSNTTQNLPELGSSYDTSISKAYEKRLGKIFMKQIRHYLKVVSDPEIQHYIQSLGQKLASYNYETSQNFSFFMVDNPDINAFAGPDGIIGINTGIILNSATEGELASVIAHEISHVTQKHLPRMFEKSKRYKLPTIAAMLAAIALGIADPEAGKAALIGISGLNKQNQINFTRSNEEEADSIGMQLLVRAGYDPYNMPAFFQKLQKIVRFSEKSALEFLRTHPLTISRIADSVSRAASYPARKDKISYSYKLIRQKIFVNSTNSPSKAISFLTEKLKIKPINKPEEISIRYGLAYAYIKNHDYILAKQQLDYLLKDDKNNPAYLILAAKLETERSDYDAAFEIFKKANSLYPKQRPIIIAYARALLDVKQAKEAKKIIKNYARVHTHDLVTYSLLGQAEAQLGNEIETALLQVEYYYLSGETKLALDKLKFIEQKYKLNYYQQQRVTARNTELKYELGLEKSIKS